MVQHRLYILKKVKQKNLLFLCVQSITQYKTVFSLSCNFIGQKMAVWVFFLLLVFQCHEINSWKEDYFCSLMDRGHGKLRKVAANLSACLRNLSEPLDRSILHMEMHCSIIALSAQISSCGHPPSIDGFL